MSQQQLLINAIFPEELRVAIVEGQTLSGFFIETAARGKQVGNLYKGVVVHVQPSLQAAFVDYGARRNGFLPLSEIHPDYFSRDPGSEVKIQEVIKPGQEVLVQVVKEEIGTKGAALTTYIALAGRYVVLLPGQSSRAISRKIKDETQRDKLKKLVQELKLEENMGIIIRTAAEHQTKREISRDAKYLTLIWKEIKKRVQRSPAPALIYKELDLATRVVRDYFNPNITSILVDDREVFRRIKDFISIISPRHQRIVKLYEGDAPIFSKYNLEKQIEQLFDRRVPLKSGGYLVIDVTEALVAIDVNSGGATSDEELEETSYRVNLEAAAEIPRQLRLRDLGGLIVIDFIDMHNPQHIKGVEQRLRREVKKDRAKIKIGRISRFGLLELSRQHLGLNIQVGSYVECPHCQGRGLIRSAESAALRLLRRIWAQLLKEGSGGVRARCALDVANHLLNEKRSYLTMLEQRFHKKIIVEADHELEYHQDVLEILPEEPL